MLTSSTIAFAAALFASAGMAAPAPQVSSQPAQPTFFNLTAITPAGSTYPGGRLGACHEAAGEENLCSTADGEGSIFSFHADPGFTPSGYSSGAGNVTFDPYNGSIGADGPQPLAFRRADNGVPNGLFGLFGSDTSQAPLAFTSGTNQLAYILYETGIEYTAYTDFYICPYAISEGFNSFPTITFNFGSGSPSDDCSPATIFRSY